MNKLQVSEKRVPIIFYHQQTHFCRFHDKPWTVMCKGRAYYVHHVTANTELRTKPTPNNDRTGAVMVTKGMLTIVTDDNGIVEAIIEGVIA